MNRHLKLTLRRLVRRPAYTVAAILCLAVGIGANTTVFSLVDSLLLNPLPAVADPAAVAAVFAQRRTDPSYLLLSQPDLEDLEGAAAPEAFASLAAFAPVSLALALPSGERRSLDGLLVTDGYFRTLGVEPSAGRVFQGPADDASVLVSHRLATELAGASLDGVLGQRIVLDGEPFTVIGVTPPGFAGTVVFVDADVWLPLAAHRSKLAEAAAWERRDGRFLFVFGRLEGDATLAEAETGIGAAGRRIAENAPDAEEGVSLLAVPLAEASLGRSSGTARAAGGMLFVVVGLLLLIACVNVANLLVARQAEGRRETAVELALGAGQGVILRRFLFEALGLAVLGGALGLVFAVAGSRWVTDLARPPALGSRLLTVDLDGRLLAFTATVSLLTLLVFALGPSWRQARLNPAGFLQDGGSRVVARHSSRWLRRGLVVGQIAVSLVLLVAAAVFLRGLKALAATDLGFEPHHLAAFSLALDSSETVQDAIAAEDLAARLRTLPDVVTAAACVRVPLGSGGVEVEPLEVPGLVDASERPVAIVEAVGSDYFATLELPLRRGRGLEAQDQHPGSKSVVVSESVAARLWDGQDPVGQIVRSAGSSPSGDPAAGGLVVVGVVADSKVLTPWEAPRLVLYVPLATRQRAVESLLVRTRGDAGLSSEVVEREVRAVLPGARITARQPMDQVIRDALWAPRLVTSLVGAFGVLGLVLAVSGLYGIVSLTVAGRRREVALCTALGADRGRIVRRLAIEGLGLSAVGVGVGLALSSFALPGAIRLSGLGAGLDPGSLALAGGLMVAITVLATSAPVWRASGRSPVEVLRQE